MLSEYKVQRTSMWSDDYKTKLPAFKVVAYSGPGVNFPTESKLTASEAEAIGWAKKANAGENVPEAGFGSYSDD